MHPSQPQYDQLVVTRWGPTMRFKDPLPQCTAMAPAMLANFDQTLIQVQDDCIFLAEARGHVIYRIVGWDAYNHVLICNLETDARKKDSSTPYTAGELYAVLQAAGEQTEVVATTPHGSYTFDVMGIENAPGNSARVVLKLVERPSDD